MKEGNVPPSKRIRAGGINDYSASGPLPHQNGGTYSPCPLEATGWGQNLALRREKSLLPDPLSSLSIGDRKGTSEVSLMESERHLHRDDKIRGGGF